MKDSYPDKGVMNTLKPTLWRTCRVIANETRLRLLWALFAQTELCVSDAAKRVEMGNAQASLQLRALNARGLISSRREKMKVFYRPAANDGVIAAPELLEGLRQCYDRGMTHRAVIRQATAFTHQRRIELVKALEETSMDWDELIEKTGMSSSSIYLHLDKLIRRGFVAKKGARYRLSCPRNRFGALLLRIALS